MNSYVKQALAFIQGDTAGVIAEKNRRQATSAVKGQLAALDGRLISAEGAVENAEEALNKAKYPTSVITDQEAYAENLAEAFGVLEAEKEEKANIEKSIVFFKSLLEDFQSDVKE